MYAVTKQHSMHKRATANLLVVFIAVLLLTIVSVAVFVQEIAGMRGKAVDTGGAATQQARANMRVFKITGADGRTQLDQISVVFQVQSGSERFALSSFIVQAKSHNTTTLYRYSGGESYQAPAVAPLYGVSFLRTVPTHMQGYLQPEETVELTFILPQPLTQKETLSVELIASDISKSTVTVSAPSVYTTSHVHLYP
jgi:archaellin